MVPALGVIHTRCVIRTTNPISVFTRTIAIRSVRAYARIQMAALSQRNRARTRALEAYIPRTLVVRRTTRIPGPAVRITGILHRRIAFCSIDALFIAQTYGSQCQLAVTEPIDARIVRALRRVGACRLEISAARDEHRVHGVAVGAVGALRGACAWRAEDEGAAAGARVGVTEVEGALSIIGA